jgi:hypothetical protein
VSAWRVSSTQNVECALLFMLCLAAGDVGRSEVPDVPLKRETMADSRVRLLRVMLNATLEHVSSSGRSGGQSVEALDAMSRCLDAWE